MGDTKIEWTRGDDGSTGKTWNPVTGCDRVSAGCDNCYAATMAARFHRPFFGAVELHEDRIGQPLRWRKPRRVFVNSVSDLFHPDVDDLFLARVFAVMSLTPQHTYQILTKRHKAMQGVLSNAGGDFVYKVWLERRRLLNLNVADDRREREVVPPWPLPNVWLGVSVEDQHRADQRIPYLLETPAAVRFISAEPLLGPIGLSLDWVPGAVNARREHGALDWVIVGGESGHGARPMSPAWARHLRDQCVITGIPFFFKQWGEWGPVAEVEVPAMRLNGTEVPGTATTSVEMVRMGKGRAGRVLDGRTWDEYPS